MNDHTELFTIGQLAAHTGLSVRTIRFWSDIGLIPPTTRSAGGYRLYDAEAVARLDLVRTLRELGLDLDTVGRVLDRQTTVAEVARTHVCALDAEIRTLQLRRAVLRSVAKAGSTTEEMRLMHKLATLSAEQRQLLIDEFVDRTFDGISADDPGAHIANAMRQLPTELPQDPTPEQVDAWVELAELTRDEGFQRRVREMAVTGAQARQQHSAPKHYDPAPILEHAGGALAAGIAPESGEAKEILDRMVPADTSGEERTKMADQLATFTDRQVERYWQLIGVLNDRPAFPPVAPAFEWLIAALRAPR